MKLMLIMVLICLLNWTNSQTCLKSNGSQCINCVENMHLYQGTCIKDIANCKTYLNGIDCTECKPGYILETSNICIANSSIESQYNSVHFIQVSIMQALSDINYIIGINQITSEIKQLHDQTPTKILAQQGYETMKLINVRYVIDFEVVNKDKVKVLYQVLMKVNSLDGKVVIDSFKQKQPTTTIGKQTLQSSNTTKTAATISQTQLTQKSNYKDIGVDTSKGDLYLLIFLDNVNKTIEKALQQLGVKSTRNQIMFIGRLESNDFVYYWVEVRIMVDNVNKLLRVRGIQNKVTYEVKITQLIEDKSIQVGNSNNSNTNSSNNSKTNSNTNTNTNSSSSNNNMINSTSTVTTQNKDTTNTSSSFNTTNNTTTNNTTIVQVKDNKDIIGLPNQSNASSTNATTSLNTTTASNATSNLITPNTTTLSSQSYNSPIYQQLNQTLLTKSSGFQQLDSKLFTKDQPLILVTQKFLSSRPNRSTIKLYKTFAKNYALKAQYKMFFIDQTIDSPNVVVYQGFATYDFLRKRVYVVSFGQIFN